MVAGMPLQIHKHPVIERYWQWQAREETHGALRHLRPLEWIHVSSIKNGSIDVVTERRAESEIRLRAHAVMRHVVVGSDIQELQMLDNRVPVCINVRYLIERIAKHDATADHKREAQGVHEEHNTPEGCENKYEHPLVHHGQHHTVNLVGKFVVAAVRLVVQTTGPPFVRVVLGHHVEQKVMDYVLICSVETESSEET